MPVYLLHAGSDAAHFRWVCMRWWSRSACGKGDLPWSAVLDLDTFSACATPQ